MPVCNEIIAVIVFLHLYKTLHSAVIVSEVQVTCRAYAAKDDFFHVFYIEKFCVIWFNLSVYYFFVIAIFRYNIMKGFCFVSKFSANLDIILEL